MNRWLKSDYKSVWAPVIELLILEKEPDGQSTQWILSGGDSQIVGCTPMENLFTDHMVFCYMKRLCHPLSSICHITGRRRKGKSLEVPCKYNYYCGIHKRPSVYFHYNASSLGHQTRPGVYTRPAVIRYNTVIIMNSWLYVLENTY